MNKSAVHPPSHSHCTPDEPQITPLFFISCGRRYFSFLFQVRAPWVPHREGKGRSQWCCFYFYRICCATWYLRSFMLTEAASSLWFNNCDQTLTTLQAIGNYGGTLLPQLGGIHLALLREGCASPSVNMASVAWTRSSEVGWVWSPSSSPFLNVNSGIVSPHLMSSIRSTTRSEMMYNGTNITVG